ncbi:LacI family DNA-binding transcriptional regulator [Herbiconiux sp. A18JL235]|uniref:LacI family DNA-binding transcriptional regulator n=1 Tax=Herbiconiux sp. A18JL235 TaxID=3152363 RepID=A0AB39BHH2_9MICO
MSRKPTISDVAQQAGVSKGLVSFVFNGRPGVSAGTRERILTAAAELGWSPNPNARSLTTRTAYALGLVVLRDPTIIGSDPFFPAFISGVESVLADAGRVMVLSVVPDEERELATYRKLAAESRVDGVFLTDLRHADPRISLLDGLGLPAVTLGRPDVPSVFPVIDRDYGHGIDAVVERLRDLGHVRIAHVAGDDRMLHGTRRRDQFAEAVTSRGGEAVVVAADFSPDAGAQATHALLSSENPPTAIVFANDPMAIAGMAVAQELGRRLPDDLSITGMDGSEMSRYLFPPLATVGNDPAEWGRAAARSLLTLIETGASDDVTLPAAAFIPRGSIAPPPTVAPSTR